MLLLISLVFPIFLSFLSNSLFSFTFSFLYCLFLPESLFYSFLFFFLLRIIYCDSHSFLILNLNYKNYMSYIYSFSYITLTTILNLLFSFFLFSSIFLFLHFLSIFLFLLFFSLYCFIFSGYSPK